MTINVSDSSRVFSPVFSSSRSFATSSAVKLQNHRSARASIEDSEKKLKRAGADRVISPYKVSGTEMARLALHPQVSGTQQLAAQYRMEEIEVGEGCQGAGRTVGDVRGGAFIVGLRHADGSFDPMPAAEATLCPGDVIMALGTPNTLDRLEALFVTARPAPVS